LAKERERRDNTSKEIKQAFEGFFQSKLGFKPAQSIQSPTDSNRTALITQGNF
jgi:hypothetical protein